MWGVKASAPSVVTLAELYDFLVMVEELCGSEVKLLTSSRLQGRAMCLSDYMKEIEKYRKNLVVGYDEDREPAATILARALSEAPGGYTLLSVKRARNSTHLWEAEYEKTELFEGKCS